MIIAIVNTIDQIVLSKPDQQLPDQQVFFPDGLPSTTHHVVAPHQGSTNNTRTLTSSLAGRPTMILPSKTAVYQTLAKQCRETVESRILQTDVHKRDSLSSSLSVLLMSSQAPGKCARSSL